jgi:pimeloyl-ACP methyl ester carboxylesterase
VAPSWLAPASVGVLGLIAAGPIALAVELNPANSLTLAGWLVLAPLAMGTLLGKALVVPDFWSREMALPPFVAIRPQGSGDILLARFRMAAISAGLSWLGLGACLLGILGLRGDSSLLRQYWHEFSQSHPAPVAGVALVLGILSLFLLTWRQLVISSYLGLSGRVGVFTATVVGSFGLYFVGLPWAFNWALDRGVFHCEPLVPWRLMIGAITLTFILKMGLAAWVWFTICRRNLLSWRRAAWYGLLWGLGTACMVTFVELAVPAYDWVRHAGAMFCLLVMPLVRPALALVTLDANRHRATSAGTVVRLSSALSGVAAGPTSSASGRRAPGKTAWSAVLVATPALGLSVTALSAAVILWGQVPHLVGAEECRLRLLQLGKGGPTVVLESDLLGVIENWWPVQRELARDARVVVYERAGRGGSSADPSPASAQRAMRQLHAALVNAKAPPPYLLVGDGLGGPLVRVFAHLFPQEVAGIVLLDPLQLETSTEALDWLRANRPELMPKIQDALTKFPLGVHGLGFREFKRAEEKLDKLPPEARAGARPAAWDEVTDGTLYATGIRFGYLEAGVANEFAHMDDITLEDRAAWPLSPVPVTVVTAMKPGIYHSIQRLAVDEEVGRKKLANHQEWVSHMPGAKHLVTLESGANIPEEQPEFVVKIVRSMLSQIRTADPTRPNSDQR